jgi:hypothetical protein
MKTQQYSHKLNNQPGYPFLSLTVENNDIGLSIHSFTSAILGNMSIVAYSPCFQNDIKLNMKENRLIIKVDADHEFDRPLKMHLLDKETQYMLRSGLTAEKNAEIRLDSNYLYSITDYCLVSHNVLQINLSYRPDLFKTQNKTA